MKVGKKLGLGWDWLLKVGIGFYFPTFENWLPP